MERAEAAGAPRRALAVRHHAAALVVIALAWSLAPLAALRAQSAGCDAPNASLVASAWRAYRADSAAVALARFAPAVRACPGNADARVGLGFAALRLGRLAEADSAFSAVTRAAPEYADAWDGLALVRNRQGDRAAAVDAWQRVVSLDPANRSARTNLDRLAPDWERGAAPPVKRRSAELDVSMRVRGTQFELRTGDAVGRPSS